MAFLAKKPLLQLCLVSLLIIFSCRAISALSSFQVEPGEYCASKDRSNNGLEIVSLARTL